MTLQEDCVLPSLGPLQPFLGKQPRGGNEVALHAKILLPCYSNYMPEFRNVLKLRNFGCHQVSIQVVVLTASHYLESGSQ